MPARVLVLSGSDPHRPAFQTINGTAQVSLLFLAGEQARDIPPETVANVTMFDWRELGRWGLGEETLRPGSMVRFQVLTFWELYHPYVIGTVAACIVEALLITWLLVIQRRRKRAEHELERSVAMVRAEHRRLDQVVSNVPGVVWEALIDPLANARKTTFISDYVEKMLGYTAAEWMAAKTGFGLSIVLEEDREKVRRLSEGVIRSRQAGRAQFRWRAKDGRILWVESHINPVMDEAGNVVGLRGVSLDITEQKLAELSLRETKERDRAILRAIPDMMFLMTLDGTYIDYHAKHAADLPVSPEVFLGKNIREILPPDVAEQFFDCFKRTEESGEPQIMEYPLRMNGSERFFEARVVASGENMLSVVRDITSRRLTEDSLKKNEAQLAAIIGSAMDAIITVDGNHQVVLFNAAAQKLFGCSADQALNQSLDRFVTGRFRLMDGEDIRSFGEVDGTSRPMGEPGELYGLKFTGEEFPLEASISRMELEGQEFYTIILRDISDQRRAHDELNQLKNQLQEENIYLQEELQQGQSLGEIVGQSEAIKEVLLQISQVAPTDSTVLITGETGTGKELVARAIQNASLRKDRPLIKVNCAALSSTLIESELFGHEKGAFTGAGARKLGRFELANGGTIFLDEIGELPMELQVKLLRVIQEGELERVGGAKTIKVDVRIIAATNRDLKLSIEEGTFRQDLWYRLNVFPITVAPLRQRKEDIPIMVDHFVAKFASKLGKTIDTVSAKSMQRLHRHSWPGNVRELANVMERAVIHSQGRVLNLAERFDQAPEVLQVETKSLKEMEREYITRTLENTGWRIEGRSGAAKILGLNPSTLRNRMVKLQIQKRPTSTFNH